MVNKDQRGPAGASAGSAEVSEASAGSTEVSTEVSGVSAGQ